jgi:hypothetical protein
VAAHLYILRDYQIVDVLIETNLPDFLNEYEEASYNYPGMTFIHGIIRSGKKLPVMEGDSYLADLLDKTQDPWFPFDRSKSLLDLIRYPYRKPLDTLLQSLKFHARSRSEFPLAPKILDRASSLPGVQSEELEFLDSLRAELVRLFTKQDFSESD